MQSKGFAHLFFIFAIALVGIALVAYIILPEDKSSPYRNIWEKAYGPQTVEEYTPTYYELLERDCEDRNHNSCCVVSVNTMKKGNFRLPTDSKCPEGFDFNQLKCAGGYEWCESPPNSSLQKREEENTNQTSTLEKVRLAAICKLYGSTWLNEYNECDSSSSNIGINEEQCLELGGDFNECASNLGCRHSDSGRECLPISVCYKLCKF